MSDDDEERPDLEGEEIARSATDSDGDEDED